MLNAFYVEQFILFNNSNILRRYYYAGPKYPLNSSSDNISIGPCHVFFKGTHVGHTYGGVTVSITQNVYELKTDQYGDTPVRTLEGGLRIEVTVNMTESTFTNLKVLFASAKDETTHLTFGKPVGTAISTGELVIQPT